MITSRHNAIVKQAKLLLDKKGRKESGRFLLEGQKLVADAFARGVQVETVFTVPEKIAEFENIPNDCEIVFVSEDVLKVLCDAKTPQGVVAVAKIPEAKPYDGKSALILDRLQDPKNLGSILRTALAADVKNIFMIDCADAYSSKALRAGMSGQFGLNLMEVSEADALRFTQDLPLIAADMRGTNIFSFSAPREFALILGNEGGGISDNLMQHTDFRVSIPMANSLESLNVAVSAGIMLYQLKQTVTEVV